MEPVACGDCASFDFHTTAAGMLSAPLVGHQVIQVCELCQKRLLASVRMMEPLHREQFPLDGVMGLVSQRAGHQHLGVCQDGIPAGLLVLKPAPHPLAIGRPRRDGDVIGKVTQPLAECKHPSAHTLARTV